MRVRRQFTFRVWLSLLALGLVFWVLAAHARVLFTVAGVVFGALLLSLSIRPLAEILARRKVPRGVTVLAVYLGLAGILALVVILVVPIIATEVQTVQESGPQFLQSAYHWLSGIPGIGQSIPSDGAILRSLTQRFESILGGFLAMLAKIGRLLLNVLIGIVLAYFFTTDQNMGERFIQTWFPERRQRGARVLMERLSHRLSRWVWAQAAICLYFAVTYGLALVILGIPFGFTIAIIGGLLEIIPYFGSGTALALGLLSALSTDPVKAIWVAVVFTVIVEFKVHVIEPNFYGRVIGLHPAAVVLALLIGGEAAGIVGMLFSVPVAAVLVTVIQEVKEGPIGRHGVLAESDTVSRKAEDEDRDRAVV